MSVVEVAVSTELDEPEDLVEIMASDELVRS